MNWQNLFSELLLEENASALKSYLACTNSFTSQITSTTKSLQDCVTEWELAEYSWLKVEKRLRTIITVAVTENMEARLFVTLLEEILLEFYLYLQQLEEISQNKEDPLVPMPSFSFPLPDDQKHLFLRPLKLKLSTRSLPTLQIALINSAYHRLLLHATCQFHGTFSKSMTEQPARGKKTDKEEAVRVTNITPFSRSRTNTQHRHHTVSLIPFVFSRYPSRSVTSEDYQDK